MKKHLLFLFLIAAAIINYAQEIEADLTELLHLEINKLRVEEGVNELQINDVLNAAAFDQAEYIFDVGKITHEQSNKKTKTVMNRVIGYDGFFYQLAENASQISRGSRELLELGGSKITVTSNEQIIQAVIISWLKDTKASKLNLLDPNFYQIGISVLSKDEINYTFDVVFGSQPYLKPTGVKISQDNYNIKPYNDLACKTFLTNFPTLPQLFSDVIEIEDDEIVLKYHSLPLFKELLSGSDDAFFIDIIQRNQFNCLDGNRLFSNGISKGYLMKPFKKGKLLTTNKLDSINEVYSVYSELPNFFEPSKDEMNLVIVKEGVNCVTVPFNNQKIKNLKWYNLPLLLAGESSSNVFEWQDSIEFKYNSLGDWQSGWVADSTSLASTNFEFASKSKFEQISPIELARDSKVKIAWDSLNRFIKDTYYQLDLAELNETEKVDFLKKSILEDKDLKIFLERLNVVEIKVSGKIKLDNELSQAQKVELFDLFLKSNKLEPALFIQAKLLQNVREGLLNPTELPQANPSQQANTLELINNQIVLEKIIGNKQFDGNPLYLAFFELYLINKSQAELAFNYHVTQLEMWSKNLSNIKKFEAWEEGFSKISIDKIPIIKYARAKLNYYLVAADYYYERGDFQRRKKSFIELMKWHNKADLSDEEVLDLAKTLCYHDQYSNAILLLKNTENLNENKELLFYFLQIGQYNKILVSEKSWIEKLHLAKMNFPTEFCQFFSNKQIGIQSLNISEVKKLYCSFCNPN